MAGVAITNSCTGIVHSYDHPGPEYALPHGVVCGLMLPAGVYMCGVQQPLLVLAKRLGLAGESDEALYLELVRYLDGYIRRLGMKTSFADMKIDRAEYYEKAGEWADISLDAFATLMSPAGMDHEKGMRFYDLAYRGVGEI